jgi:hypothetical protein
MKPQPYRLGWPAQVALKPEVNKALARQLTNADQMFEILFKGDGDQGGGNSGHVPPHAPTHEPGGSDPMTVDAPPFVGSLRTLGTGADQACAGNDPRLSGGGGGAPAPHAATHAAGGTDPVTLQQGQIVGLLTDLNAKAPLASPTFTGLPTAPTQPLTDNGNALATTAFVKGQAYAPIASPVLTGTPTAPTMPLADNGNALATTAFVKGQNYATVGAAPTAHAASHASGGSDPVTLAESQVTNLVTDLAAKAPLVSPVFTGTVTTNGSVVSGGLSVGSVPATTGIIDIPNNTNINGRNAANTGDINLITVSPTDTVGVGLNAVAVVTQTPAVGDNSTKIATTAFVNTAIAPRIQTTVLTGTQSNFAVTAARRLVLRCNQSGLLTISGFAAGSDGDMIDLFCVGASSMVNLTDQDAGSSAANRIITGFTETMLLSPPGGATRLVYDATTARWRIAFSTGRAWAQVPYSAANFTAIGTGSWTVDSGDQLAFNYYKDGRKVTVNVTLDTTTVTGSVSGLKIAIPASIAPAAGVQLIGLLYDNSGSIGTPARAYVLAGGLYIGVDRLDGALLTPSTNNTYVRVSLTYQW